MCIDPLVVESHPSRAVLALEAARLRGLPEVRRVHVLSQLNGVQGPTALHGLTPDQEGLGKDRALGRRARVHVATEVEGEWADEEDDGGESVRKPETDVLERERRS